MEAQRLYEAYLQYLLDKISVYCSQETTPEMSCFLDLTEHIFHKLQNAPPSTVDRVFVLSQEEAKLLAQPEVSYHCGGVCLVKPTAKYGKLMFALLHAKGYHVELKISNPWDIKELDIKKVKLVVSWRFPAIHVMANTNVVNELEEVIKNFR